MAVFFGKRYYAAHVGLASRPFLGRFGEKIFDARRSSVDEYADRLISVIFETVNRAARGVDAVAGR